MKTHKDLVVHHFKKQADFLKWLKSHHDQPESIWLKLAKKKADAVSVTYEEAREAAIMYGWIDGLVNKLDDQYYLIKFSKRRLRSVWSKINREIAKTLIKEKRMQPSGQAEVDRAKKDGRWQAAYDSAKDMTLPTWFTKQLKKNKKAYEFFQSLNKANRYSVAYTLRNAKKEETKQRRAAQYIEMFKNQQKIH